MTRHLDELRARGFHQLTRGVVHLVVPAEEARVVVRDVLADGRHLHELLRTDQPVEQLRVVNHLVGAADLRVLVVQGVEAVRTGDDDLALALLDTVEHPVEGLDVLLRQLLEQELVARATSGVTAAGLVGTEHHELHAGGREQLGDSLRGLLRAVLVGTGATDPEQVVVALEAVRILAEDRDVELHLVDPVETVLGVLAPGVALVLEVLEQTRELGREVRLDEHLVAAHVDDVVDVLDVDRALLHARTTVGAAPQRFGVDDRGEFARLDHCRRVTDELALGFRACPRRNLGERSLVGIALGVHEPDLVAADVLAATGQQVRRLGVAVVAQRRDQQLRRQRLTGVPRGALRLAATALGARGEVEPALPREVLDPAGTEGVLVRVRFLHVDGLATRHHLTGSTEGDAAVVLTLEVDVEEGREAVPCDTPRDVAADDVEPHHAGHQLDEREHRHQFGALGKNPGHLHREEVGVGVVVVVGRDLAGLHQNHAEALEEHDGLDEVRGLEVGAAEARQPAGLTRVIELADGDQRQNADHGADAQDLVDEVVDGRVADDGPVEVRVERLAVGLEPDDGAEHETDHDQPVRPADGTELGHLRVRDELDEHLLEAREERAPPVRGRLADPDGLDHRPRAADEREPTHEAEQHADRAQRDRQGIHTWPFVSGAAPGRLV